MSIVKTITDDYYFWNWVKNSDSYSNNFSLEGAKALQAYLEEYSEETGENLEFDPVAWCCEFAEYESLADFNQQYDLSYTEDDLLDRTTVIPIDGSQAFVIGEF